MRIFLAAFVLSWRIVSHVSLTNAKQALQVAYQYRSWLRLLLIRASFESAAAAAASFFLYSLLVMNHESHILNYETTEKLTIIIHKIILSYVNKNILNF